MRRGRRVFLAGLGSLGACSGTPPEVARLPEFGGFVSIDPVRYSIEQGADILTNPHRNTGQPWEVARLIQGLEFLAVELPNGPRWNVTLPMAQLAVPAARPEWRRAFGIAADARAQEVIDSLTELRSAFAARSPATAAAALHAPLFTPGGQDTLNRFGEPPSLPRTTRAMLDARIELAAGTGERRTGQAFIAPLRPGVSVETNSVTLLKG